MNQSMSIIIENFITPSAQPDQNHQIKLLNTIVCSQKRTIDCLVSKLNELLDMNHDLMAQRKGLVKHIEKLYAQQTDNIIPFVNPSETFFNVYEDEDKEEQEENLSLSSVNFPNTKLLHRTETVPYTDMCINQLNRTVTVPFFDFDEGEDFLNWNQTPRLLDDEDMSISDEDMSSEDDELPYVWSEPSDLYFEIYEDKCMPDGSETTGRKTDTTGTKHNGIGIGIDIPYIRLDTLELFEIYEDMSLSTSSVESDFKKDIVM